MKTSLNVKTIIRIKDIELRVVNFNSTDKYIEVVQWYPNKYYGTEKLYKYDENTEQYYDDKNSVTLFIHKSCFKHPESCYTIARIKVYKDEIHDVNSVGNRPFELNKENSEAYLDVIKYSYKHVDEIRNMFYDTENSDELDEE